MDRITRSRASIKLQLCGLCLEMHQTTFVLSKQCSSTRSIRETLDKYLELNFAGIVDTAIDCICADCWQTIKTFDEFCQRIGDAHLQAISVDLKCEYASIDDSIPCANLESIVDIKPTASKLQEALAIPVEQPQPLSLNNQTEDKKMFDLALSSCGNDDNNTVFDDIPDTWSDTNSEDYFLTSEDVAKGNSKVTACVNPDGGGPEKDDSVQTVVTGIQTKKQRRKSQETWRPASESKRCEICNVWVGTFAKHKSHMTKVHGVTDTYVCELCGHLAGSKQVYTNHIEAVHMAKTYDCDICGDRFHTRTNILTHMRRRHGDNPCVECEVCHIMLTKKNLTRHRLLHDPERRTRHKCIHCGKGFPNNRKLKEHISIHTGLLPIQCADCDKRFRFSSTLSLHRSKEHKISTGPPKKYKCEFCENVYSSASSRYTHRKRHHPDAVIQRGVTIIVAEPSHQT